MFLKYFNAAKPGVLLSIGILGLLFWINAFISGVQPPQTVFALPFYKFIFLFTKHFSTLSIVFAFILVIGQAFYINYVCVKYDLSRKNSYVTALIYLTLMSSVSGLLCMHQILLCNCFLLPILHLCLSLYEKHDAFRESFQIGFLIAIASLIYYPLAFFLLLIWIAFIIFRLFTWREWLIILLGLIILYLFIFTYFFWFKNLGFLFNELRSVFYSLNPIAKFNTYELIVYLSIAFVLLLSLGYTLIHISERIIFVRKMQFVIIWMLLFSGVLSTFAVNVSPVFFSLMNIPATILISNYLSNRKKRWLVEMIYIVLLSEVIIFKFI